MAELSFDLRRVAVGLTKKRPLFSQAVLQLKSSSDRVVFVDATSTLKRLASH